MKSRARWIRSVGTNAFYYVTGAAALAAIVAPELRPIERVLPLATSFLVVLVHELAHWGTARATGRRVTKLVVTPWLGLTRVGHPNPHDASWALIAAAGPVAASIFAGAALFAVSLPEIAAWPGATRWVEIVLVLSLLESAGNLLPFGELDGKKVVAGIVEASARRKAARCLAAWAEVQEGAAAERSPSTSACSGGFSERHSSEVAEVAARRESVEGALSFLNELMESSGSSESARKS